MSRLSPTDPPVSDTDQFQRIDRVMWMPALLLLALCALIGVFGGSWPLVLAVVVLAVVPVACLHWWRPGHSANSFAKAALYMVLSGLLIEQSGGLIEAHFSIFIMLSALILYSDWRVIVFGAGFIALHHALFTWLQYQGAVTLYATIGGHDDHGGGALLLCLLQHGGAVVAQAMVLGYLATVVRSMVQDGVQVARFAESAGQGRLDVDFGESGRTRPVLAAIAGMQERLTATLKQVSTTTGAVGELGQALSATHAILREQAERNGSEVERVSASATQLSATTRETAAEAGRVRELASEAAEHARQGRVDIQALDNAMTRLEKDAAGIAALLGDIDNITFQTNILALNASVEAARAGDAGRGFGVVAGEVRKLSEQTRSIAERIHRRIAETGDSVKAGSDYSRRATEAMDRVSGTFDQVVSRLTGIDSASRQQHHGIEDLERSVQNMHTALAVSRDSLDEAHATVRLLGDSADELADAVSFFRLHDGLPGAGPATSG